MDVRWRGEEGEGRVSRFMWVKRGHGSSSVSRISSSLSRSRSSKEVSSPEVRGGHTM